MVANRSVKSSTRHPSEGVSRISAAEAKAHLPTLLKRIKNGERITITLYNRPVADLVPSSAAERPVPKFGTLKGRARILDPNWHIGPQTDSELEAWLEGRFE